MPKEFTHIHIARDVLRQLEEMDYTNNILMSNKDHFILGSVLPDTPAYLNSGKHSFIMKETDKNFHDSKNIRFTGFINVLQNCRKSCEEMTALSLGTLCHIISDSVFHPMVYHFSGISDIKTHFRLESDIDMIFHNYGSLKKMRLANQINFKNINTGTVAEFLAIFFLNDITACPVMKMALKKHLLYQRAFTMKRTGSALKFANRFLRLGLDNYFELFYNRTPSDILKQGIISYMHPVTGNKYTDTLESLKKRASDMTVEHILRLGDLSKREVLEEKVKAMSLPNLLTGLKKVKLSDAVYFSRKDT